MKKAKLSQLILTLAIVGTAMPAHALTQDELVTKLQAAGYTEISDVKSTAEGMTAKAMKNGKPVRLVIDSSGQVKEQN